MTQRDSQTPATPSAATLFPGGWAQRLWFAWATVAVPALAFAFAFTDVVKPEWQRPDAAGWILLLLSRAGAGAFAPLALVAVAVNAAIAVRPGPWVAGAFPRTALAVAFVYAVQYSLMVPAAIFLQRRWAELPLAFAAWAALAFFLLAVYAATFAAGAIFTFLRQRLPPAKCLLVAGLKTLAFLFAAAWLLPPEAARKLAELLRGSDWSLAFLGILAVLFAGPVWAADALGRLAWRLGRPARWPKLLLGGALGAYLLAWRLAVGRAVEAYDALPTVDPSCFVATAAARGPRWLTGGFDARGAGGRLVAVSPQLQRFKLFEIALRELSPRGHRALRRAYDRVGPAIAAWGRTPARAGMLWLALRPAELLAAALLRLLAGREIARRAGGIYR